MKRFSEVKGSEERESLVLAKKRKGERDRYYIACNFIFDRHHWNVLYGNYHYKK
jgi:hypothetical protein